MLGEAGVDPLEEHHGAPAGPPAVCLPSPSILYLYTSGAPESGGGQEKITADLSYP